MGASNSAFIGEKLCFAVCYELLMINQLLIIKKADGSRTLLKRFICNTYICVCVYFCQSGIDASKTLL